MKIEEGLNLKPTFRIPYWGKRGVEIPGTKRWDLPQFAYDRGCRVGVEVGVDRGHFGVRMCQVGLKMFGIDPYEAYLDYREKRDYRSHYSQAVENLKGLDYTIIKKYSRDALDDFEDRSLDFIYIDGNHAFPYVAYDIFGWEQKLKDGGIMSGHDYGWIIGRRERKHPKVYDGVHVKGAVDVCAYIMRVDRVYVLGERYAKYRDKQRSWFWIKGGRKCQLAT